MDSVFNYLFDMMLSNISMATTATCTMMMTTATTSMMMTTATTSMMMTSGMISRSNVGFNPIAYFDSLSSNWM